jgi:transposase
MNTFPIFPANAQGIKQLLAIEPDIAILEPTGVNYSKLWRIHLARNGIEVRLVSHNELRGYRRTILQLPDKDDGADALALACYGFDFLDEPRRFLQLRDPTIVKIRELVLRLAHLNQCQSPIVNRLRQDLAWQFPEIAAKSFRRSSDKPPLTLLWLAGIVEFNKLDRVLISSVGLGLKSTVRHHARRLCDIHREEVEIEFLLSNLTDDPRFDTYRQIFHLFGFGQRVEAIIFSQIFPIENYLLESGKPEIIFRRGRFSGKPTKRYLSQRRFQKALGVAPTENSSGDKLSKSIVSGSDLCRIALWQWIFTRIEVRRNRPKNEIGKILGEFCDSEKASKKPIRLIRSRIAAKAVRLLFDRDRKQGIDLSIFGHKVTREN